MDAIYDGRIGAGGGNYDGLLPGPAGRNVLWLPGTLRVPVPPRLPRQRFCCSSHRHGTRRQPLCPPVVPEKRTASRRVSELVMMAHGDAVPFSFLLLFLLLLLLLLPLLLLRIILILLDLQGPS